MVTASGHGLTETDIDHPGLNDRSLVVVIDLEDLIHSRHFNDDGAIPFLATDWHGA